MDVALEREKANLLLMDLLLASKAAERLISAFFEVGAIHGEPFMSIWTHLDKAIDQAQQAIAPRKVSEEQLKAQMNSA